MRPEDRQAREVAEDIITAFEPTWPVGRLVRWNLYPSSTATVVQKIVAEHPVDNIQILYVRVEYVENGKAYKATWKWDDCEIVDE